MSHSQADGFVRAGFEKGKVNLECLHTRDGLVLPSLDRKSFQKSLHMYRAVCGPGVIAQNEFAVMVKALEGARTNILEARPALQSVPSPRDLLAKPGLAISMNPFLTCLPCCQVKVTRFYAQ